MQEVWDKLALAPPADAAYVRDVASAALLVNGYIPVALSNSEGAGSVRTVVRLPGAHLYIQVLGNERTKRLRAGSSHFRMPKRDFG